MIASAQISSAGPLSDGRDVQLITIGSAPGPVLQLLDLGATVHALELTCGDGVRRNVVLGHAEPEDHLHSTAYLGGIVGRYANRIAKGKFSLAGKEVQVRVHDRGNSLHGGPDGFDRRTWQVVDVGAQHAELRLVSPDGDQGFPGELTATVRFAVTDDAVRVELSATTTGTTVANLTSHAYFNLNGVGERTVDDHLLSIEADEFTPVDETSIPQGPAGAAHLPVAGTPFDFREPTVLGSALRRRHPQLDAAHGIDHNFVLRGAGLRPVARMVAPGTGTSLELRTDQPGLQVYTGNFLDGTLSSASGGVHRQGDGIALEPQLFPDSVNRPEFDSAVLEPGETYSSVIEWRFGVVPTALPER